LLAHAKHNIGCGGGGGGGEGEEELIKVHELNDLFVA
jgi:hypothetical protein